MDVTIKKAGISDMELLLKWRMDVLHEVFSVPADCDMEELEQENRRYYQSMLETGGHIACFAYSGNDIIGCGGVCVYHEMPSPDNPSGKCAYLMNIYISPQVRRQGIGKIIVGWLTDQATKLGITKIYLETSQVGRMLYEKAGFIDMPDMMKLNAIIK